MKRDITDIFDGITPSELDSFSDELGSPALPIGVRTALKKRVLERAGIKERKDSLTGIWVRLAALAAAFAIILSFAIASNSSTNIMEGAYLRATANISWTLRMPNAALPLIKLFASVGIKVASAAFAIALANIVLPVPDGP